MVSAAYIVQIMNSINKDVMKKIPKEKTKQEKKLEKLRNKGMI